MKLPFTIDLTDKVVVVTGAGGIICSAQAIAAAKCGAKVALLDLNKDNAQKYVDEIVAEGGIAKAYACNVLEKESIQAVNNARKVAMANGLTFEQAKEKYADYINLPEELK